MQLPANPFTLSPVGPELFTGRKDDIAVVYRTSREAIDTKQSKLIVVTGPRGIGKTSFLNLIRSGSAAASGNDGVDLAVFKPAFSKLEKIQTRELHDVIDIGVIERLGDYRKRYRVLSAMKRLLRRFEGGAFGISIKFSETVGMEDLLRRLRNASRTLASLPRPAVLTILLDELDPLLKKAEDLPDFIRSCGEDVGSPLVFLLAGLPPAWNFLREAHPSIPRTAKRIRLKPLQRGEVDQLMQTAVSLASKTATIRMTLAPGVSDVIFEVTGGHPSLVQSLGYHSAERLIEKLKDEPNPTRTEISISKEVIAHAQRAADFGTSVFEGWIQDLGDTERYVLWQIANLQRGQQQIEASQLQSADSSPAQTLDALKMLRDEWGLLDHRNQIVSKAFISWLKSTPVRVQAEHN